MSNIKDTHTKTSEDNKKANSSESLSSEHLLKKVKQKDPTDADTKAEPTQERDYEKEINELKKSHEQALHKLKLEHFAEHENERKKHLREEEKARNYAIQKLATDLLNIADALEQGINTCSEEQKQALEMILSIFNKTLKTHGIEPLKPEKGEAYNHHLHEAMVSQPTEELPNNHVMQTIQTGYKLKDRILRPARVIVAKNEKKKET